MISALLYLQVHSMMNRTVQRVKRLKQPKYLAGAVVGGLYFYFYFFRYLFNFRGRNHPFALFDSAQSLVLAESLGALILLTIVLMAWIIPHQRAALTFTEAEIAFLFPAPITRRGLIHFKLLRSQTAILFTTLLLMLVTNRFGGKPWVHAVGWWLILYTLNLHLLGSSFAVTRLLDRGITNWQRRLIVLGLVLLCATTVFVWARRSLPAVDLSHLDNPHAITDYLQRLFSAGPVPYLLYPFRIVVRPYLAANAGTFLSSLLPALLLIALHYVWVVRSDVAFEEASLDASKRVADKLAALRAGKWHGTQQKPRRRRAPFPLRPTGTPAVALLWKNLISAGQVFTLRVWISLVVCCVVGSLVFGQTGSGTGLRTVLGMIAVMFLGWSLLLGPQIFRNDFRQDLPLVDILKTYPLPGWQLVLGEILAPAVILTAVQWVLLILVITLFASPHDDGLDRSTVLGLGLGAAIISPVLNLITLQIPNAAVLLFPAWFQTSRTAAHGIEATGQRLIFALGQLLVLGLSLLPAAAIFTGVFFLLRLILSVPLAVPLAALAAALVLAAEAALGVIFLGWLFQRFDVSAEQ